MKVDGRDIRTIWFDEHEKTVKIIDQRKLPHELVIVDLKTVDDAVKAIKDMYVRGAPLIGVTGAYAVYLAALNAPDGQIETQYLQREAHRIKSARPTAVNLTWGVDMVLSKILSISDPAKKIDTAQKISGEIAELEVENCRKIGEQGLSIIERISRQKKGNTVQVLTHCNAGWLACIEHGTATAPIYAAFDKGIDIHVWVDETRPLNQGTRLTAWELGKHGVNHTIVTDNAGGHLMQHAMVDMVIVGTDRTTAAGDVANKIGTYLKALAAWDNNIPFYVALPSSTFDWDLRDGLKDIPIEQRDPDEIKYVQGLDRDGSTSVLICPQTSQAANFAFDVTPAKFVTGFITERGICRATEEDIRRLFPEKDRRQRPED
ncbi:MAG: S-methyl-5-thioribose-1-phosphate isomerase [Desulfobacteraceae bacterium]|jgi:methylthioribose-1-phosphate isomerase|nr:S-methyl-5-thioribose-1-phosphate isomerase [Desulfobacteraceae bacterium]